MGGIGLVWGEELPVLRYLKDPVENLNDLYNRYPKGGEHGWFSLVFSERTFAWWDDKANEWKLLNSGSATADGCIADLGNIALEDLDDVTEPGLYSYNLSVNRSTNTGLLEVHKKRGVNQVNASLRQVRHETGGNCERTGLTGISGEVERWDEWVLWSDKVATKQEVSEVLQCKDIPSDVTGLDDLLSPGVYKTANKAATEKLMDKPDGVKGTAVVQVTSSSWHVKQEYTDVYANADGSIGFDIYERIVERVEDGALKRKSDWEETGKGAVAVEDI